MKDYMGELERERYCMFLVLLKVSQELLETNLLSKEEKTNLKKTIAFGQKVNFLTPRNTFLKVCFLLFSK